MSTTQPALAGSSAHAGKTEPEADTQWMLHLQTVHLIWSTSSLQKTTITAQYISRRTRMHWPMNGPAIPYMTSLQLRCSLRSSGRSGKTDEQSFWWPPWQNQSWFPELTQLLSAAPWPIPLRNDLLSQAKGMIWHPQPELWALHLWPLNRSLLTSPRES